MRNDCMECQKTTSKNMIKPILSFITKPDELEQLRDQESLNTFINNMNQNCTLDVIGIAKDPYNQSMQTSLPNRSIKSFVDIPINSCNIASDTLSAIQKHGEKNFTFIDGMMATSVNFESLSKILDFYKPIDNIGSQALFDRGNKLLIDDRYTSSIEIIANVLNKKNEVVQTVQFPISVEADIQTMPVYPYLTDVFLHNISAVGIIAKQYPEIKDWVNTSQQIIHLYSNVALSIFRKNALFHLSRNPHLYVLTVSGDDLYAIVPNENFGIKNPKFFGISLSDYRMRDDSRWNDYVLFKTESGKWCGVKYECSLKKDENLRTHYAHTDSLAQVQLIFGANDQTNAFFIGALSESDLPKEIF